MAEFIYFYAVDNDWRPFQPEDTGPNHAQKIGARGIGVANLDELDKEFQKLKAEGVKIDRMVIETHGSPGAMYMGNSVLSSGELSRFTGKGYDELFVENARIFLNGCNIAEQGEGCALGCSITGDGRRFLKEFALMFLGKNGGRVGASTSLGIANPFNDKVYHLWGNVVFAYVKKGSKRVIIKVGKELSSPNGQWQVSGGGETFYYWFYSSPKQYVKWEDEGFLPNTGKGEWAIKGDILHIDWESGATEDWDLPLFSEEQSGLWTKANGITSSIMTKKMIDVRYNPFNPG